MTLHRFTFLSSLSLVALAAASEGSAGGLVGKAKSAAAGVANALTGASPAPEKKPAPKKSAARKPATVKAPAKPKAPPAAAAAAPIPEAVARGDVPEEPQAPKLGREIPDLATLGKEFSGSAEAKGVARFKPDGDSPWRNRPVALQDGWHNDEGSDWNFLVSKNRLVEAVTDAAMANQPAGTFGHAQRI